MLDNLEHVYQPALVGLGTLEDLQETIRGSGEAVAATPVDHPYRAGMLNNLGNRLSTRFDWSGIAGD